MTSRLSTFLSLTVTILSTSPAIAQAPEPNLDHKGQENARVDELIKALEAVGTALEAQQKKYDQTTNSLDKVQKALEENTKTLGEEAAAKKAKVLLGSSLAWDGVLFRFSTKEKQATVRLRQFDGPSIFSLELTAPLDEETRLASLTKEGEDPAFKLTFSWEWSRARDLLGEMAAKSELDKAECRRLMGGVAGKLCERENLLSTYRGAGVPEEAQADDAFYYSIGVELTAEAERLEVYATDLAADSRTLNTYGLKLGFFARFYPLNWMAVTLKTGPVFKDGAKVGKAKRCASLPSTDEDISAQACEDVTYLRKDLESTLAGYVEGGLVLLDTNERDNVALGAEVKVGGYDLSVDDNAVDKLRVSFAVFVTPTSEPIVSQFGVGVEYVRMLQDSPSGDFESGHDYISPFLLVGGTL